MSSPQTFVGHYRIEAKVGAGGMGEVFRAFDSRLDRHVALKLLPADVASDPDRLRRFRSEARAASAINHPHILVIHDFGEVDGRAFIVSEFVEGETVRERIARGPLGVAEALAITTQVASAIGAAHARGIVHRDIKPDNVMVRPDGYVKVLDFGLMKLMRSDGDTTNIGLTEPGRLLGTPHYMSPEQARGLDTGPGTDVWSMGVLLYELLVGRPPFSGPSTADVLAAILRADTPQPDTTGPALPAAVWHLVETALAKDPARRYSSGEDFHAALLETTQGLSGGLATVNETAQPRRRHAIVGRERERDQLEDACRRIAAGRGELIAICGEPGSGKSTLAEDFIGTLRGRDGRFLVGRGRCSERLAGTDAYLPVLESLDTLLREGGTRVGERLAALAPSWHAQIVAHGSDADGADLAIRPFGASQERLKRELTALLRELSRRQPLMLFFDDVHWSDASTVDLIGYLASRFDELRLLIVVTYRPSDLQLAQHPFLLLRRELQARHLCHEISLEMLTPADVEAYLAAEFDGQALPAALAALIHTKTEGHPLFMADLVRYLTTSGAIARDAEHGWALHGSLNAIGDELPESVRAMIERKIAQLSSDDLTLLTVASVQGYAFDSAVIARVLQRDTETVEERLEAIERVHRFVTLVDERVLPDGTLTSRHRFVHVLYQNALYGQLRATRRAALSATVAETLAAHHRGAEADIATELAALYEAARQPLRAAQCCRLATQQAAQLHASQEAMVLAKRGLRLLEGTTLTQERQEAELGLLISLGNALIALRGYSSEGVLETYTRALAICDQMGEVNERAAVLYGYTAFHLVCGHYPQALALARDMLAFTERTRHPAAIVAHRLAGWALLAMGHTADALPHFERCRTLYDPETHRQMAYSFGQEPGMAARPLLAMTLQLLGRVDEAAQACDEALALVRQTSHANTRCYVWHFASVYAQSAGNRALTRSLAEEALRLAEEHGLQLWIGWSRIMRGWERADRGELDAGIADMRWGIDAASALGHALYHTKYLALLASKLIEAGRYDEATQALDEADRLVLANEERQCVSTLARLREQIPGS